MTRMIADHEARYCKKCRRTTLHDTLRKAEESLVENAIYSVLSLGITSLMSETRTRKYCMCQVCDHESIV